MVLNFVNFSKARALYRCGMTPLVRSASQPHWARLPPCNCFYYKSPRHRTSNVLSVLFSIDRSVLACFVPAPGLCVHEGMDCLSVRACACMRACVCLCVCVCAFLHDKQGTDALGCRKLQELKLPLLCTPHRTTASKTSPHYGNVFLLSPDVSLSTV